MKVDIIVQRAGNPFTRFPMPFDYSSLLLFPEVSILIAVSYRMEARDLRQNKRRVIYCCPKVH